MAASRTPHKRGFPAASSRLVRRLPEIRHVHEGADVAVQIEQALHPGQLRQLRQPVTIKRARPEGRRHVLPQLRRQFRHQMETHLPPALPGCRFQSPPSLRRQIRVMQDVHAQRRRSVGADRQQRRRRMQRIPAILVPKGQRQMIRHRSPPCSAHAGIPLQKKPSTYPADGFGKRGRTPGNICYRCFLSNLTGLAVLPPSDLYPL